MKNQFQNITIIILMSILQVVTADFANAQSPAEINAIGEELKEGEIRDLPNGAKMIGTDYFTVLVEGEGPDVVLIPGLSTPRDVWDKTREQLKDRYKVHTIQTRGFGDKAPIETLTPERRSLLDTYAFHMADYIDDYVIRIGEGQNPAIIGHSMGGLTAMIVAANMGHQVDRVMVVDSLPYMGALFGTHMTPEMMATMAESMRLTFSENNSWMTDDRSLQRMSATKAGRAQIRAWSETADTEVAAQFFHDVMIADIRNDLAGIKPPLTVLYPWDAKVMSAEKADELYISSYAKAETAKLKRIDNSRHFIMLDQPEVVAVAVEEFLKD